MTRHIAPTRRVTVRLVFEAVGERDESDHYRHNWFTTAEFGLLRARGVNSRAVQDRLLQQLTALAHSPGAVAALAAEDAERARLFKLEETDLGTAAALARLRIRACGRDPDATQVDLHEPEDDAP